MFFITKKLISLAFFGFVLFSVLYTVGFFGGESPFKKNVTDAFHSLPGQGQQTSETKNASSNTGSWQERRKMGRKEEGITHVEKGREEEEKDLFSRFYLDSGSKSDPDQFSFKNFYK